MFGPDAVTARRENPVGIDRVLESFVKTQQGVIVIRVGTHNGFLIGGGGPVFAPAMLCCSLNKLFERRAVLPIPFNVTTHRKCKNENERSLPIARWQAEGEHRQAKFFGGFVEHAISLKNRFAGSRDDGRKPHVAVRWLGIGARARADGEHAQAGYAKLWLVDPFALLRREWKLVGFVVDEPCARNCRKFLFREFPVRFVRFERTVEAELATPVADPFALGIGLKASGVTPFGFR